MNQLLIKYQKTINKLPIEARAAILATTAIFIFVVWYYILWQHLQKDISETNKYIKTLKQTIPLLQTNITTLENSLKEKRNQAIKEKLEGTSKTAPSQLIPPQKMNEVLQDLLAARYQLILLELKNLTPKAATLPQTNLQFFEHSIIIKLQGDYFSTMQYLKSIEKLGWRIFWDKLEYKVTQYPIAEITLKIHTLSEQRDLINV